MSSEDCRSERGDTTSGDEGGPTKIDRPAGGEVHEAVVTLHILHATHPTLFRLVRHCALCSFSEIRTFVHSFPVGKRTTSLRLRDAWTFLTGCLHLSGMVAGTAADRNFDAVSHANCGIGNSRARREGSRKSGLEENLFD